MNEEGIEKDKQTVLQHFKNTKEINGILVVDHAGISIHTDGFKRALNELNSESPWFIYQSVDVFDSTLKDVLDNLAIDQHRLYFRQRMDLLKDFSFWKVVKVDTASKTTHHAYTFTTVLLVGAILAWMFPGKLDETMIAFCAELSIVFLIIWVIYVSQKWFA